MRGGSNTDIIAVLVSRFWKLARRYNICVWFSRVKSNLDPAELPTRGKLAPYKAAYRASFRSLVPLFHLRRTQMRKYTAPSPRITFRRKACIRAHLKVKK